MNNKQLNIIDSMYIIYIYVIKLGLGGRVKDMVSMSFESFPSFDIELLVC